jgi:antitoxin ParD1/3/4
MATMNVSLPDAMKQWVEEQVETGRYANSSDVIRDLVRKEQDRTRQLEELGRMARASLAGGRVEITREDLIERLTKKAADAVSRQKAG